MTEHSAYGEFFEYKAGSRLWAEVHDFQYKVPTTSKMLLHYKIELAALALWAILLTIAINYSSKIIKPLYG